MLLGLVVASTGCYQQPFTEGAAPGEKIQSTAAPNATIHLNQVVFLDRDLQGNEDSHRASKVAVEQQGIAQTAGGTYNVYAIFRNRTEFPLQLECRVQFFGKSQEPVEGPSSWQRVFLPPLGVANYSESSMGVDNRTYYYIEVREGQ
jgi:hypothetical protein